MNYNEPPKNHNYPISPESDNKTHKLPKLKGPGQAPQIKKPEKAAINDPWSNLSATNVNQF